MACDDAILRMAKGELIARVEHSRGFEEALFFEMCDDCFENELADVRGAREIVSADVELLSLAEQVVQESTTAQKILIGNRPVLELNFPINIAFTHICQQRPASVSFRLKAMISTPKN